MANPARQQGNKAARGIRRHTFTHIKSTYDIALTLSEVSSVTQNGFSQKQKPKKKPGLSGLPAPSSSRCYSLTHAHRSIGYRNRNPQLLAESTVRLMHLRVYDSRDTSHQPAPSLSLCYSITHGHRTLPTPTFITITCTQVLWFLERLTRTTVSCCETTKTRLTICLPTQPSVCETF
jgi:hypothetical protein